MDLPENSPATPEAFLCTGLDTLRYGSPGLLPVVEREAVAEVQHPLQDGLQEAVGHAVAQPHLLLKVGKLQVRVGQTSTLLSGKPIRIFSVISESTKQVYTNKQIMV